MNTTIIKTIALGIAICSLASCLEEATDNDIGPCGRPYIDAGSISYTGPQGSPIIEFGGQEISQGTIYYHYRTTEAGTWVQFTTGSTAVNICNQEHLRADFSYQRVSAEAWQPVPMKIFGNAFWDPFFGDEEIILVDGLLSYDLALHVELEIGLKQVFPDEAGTVQLSTTVEFESQGGLDQDIAYLHDQIDYFGVQTRYSLFK